MAAPGEPAPAEIEPTPVSAPSRAPERPAVAHETLRSRLIAPEPRRETVVEAAPEAETDATPALASEAVPPPRFTLQLLRAGACLVLVELPTGEPFASRDPAYLLLKDMLRAAGLPDSPQQSATASRSAGRWSRADGSARARRSTRVRRRRWTTCRA